MKGIPTLILYVIGHYLLASALTLFFIFMIISAFSSGIVTTVDAPSTINYYKSKYNFFFNK